MDGLHQMYAEHYLADQAAQASSRLETLRRAIQTEHSEESPELGESYAYRRLPQDDSSRSSSSIDGRSSRIAVSRMSRVGSHASLPRNDSFYVSTSPRTPCTPSLGGTLVPRTPRSAMQSAALILAAHPEARESPVSPRHVQVEGIPESPRSHLSTPTAQMGCCWVGSPVSRKRKPGG
ncbi:MAG: hypothetical protein A3F09_04520 [Chlamydiae bacterium RIFCSPHIGHO2_12_FULL_49_11]|nr:MAG: hypothetical protein A3F09_04520 [Chlamydiae bacterium RIFCSPHIGHO2_12_FULL_49_11]